jgi:hypothetical protein
VLQVEQAPRLSVIAIPEAQNWTDDEVKHPTWAVKTNYGLQNLLDPVTLRMFA